MRVDLRPDGGDEEQAILLGELPPNGGARVLSYPTRAGALLRIDGVVRGAFDGFHRTVPLPAGVQGEIRLETERSYLPRSAVAFAAGLRWYWLAGRAVERPRTSLDVAGTDAPSHRPPEATGGALALVGHSHLDVAWLWTYEEAIRKAVRTFATAVRQLEADPSFVFTQTTPLLYEAVAEREPELFERMRALARAGRLDVSGAALWVESDCNLPSGEALLRQLVYGIRYVEEAFGQTPSVAWLPDTFGFANTLPTLLCHAGIEAFGTTKLGWNDTTVFPHAQFVWEGPDGSRVVAAQIASIEGGFAAQRVARARERGDLLLLGRGDGGGGTEDAVLAEAPAHGKFTTLGAWFARLGERLDALPVVHDELYLEEHRGTLTTHRDVKARHAALERALGAIELSVAWALALRASPLFLDDACRRVHEIWRIVLGAEFHDLLPGSAIAPAYEELNDGLDVAEELAAGLSSNLRTVLPQSASPVAAPPAAPQDDGTLWRFENGLVSAAIDRAGELVELRFAGESNLVERAMRVCAFADRPRHWDAWNLDASYRKRPRKVVLSRVAVEGDALECGFGFEDSDIVVRYRLPAHAPYLEVDVAVAWHASQRVLRLEHTLSFAAERARFGSPHGFVERTPTPRSPAERAKFEAAGQRYARLDGASGGVAFLTRDTYGWSLGTGRTTEVGNSLLRAPEWPDPGADRGTHEFAFAVLPFATLGMGELEAHWSRFAGMSGVPMFSCDDPAIAIVATKPADDGDGIVVRARECDGVRRDVSLRSAVPVREVRGVDALERPLPGDFQMSGEGFSVSFDPYQLRSFRVRLP